MSETTDKTSAKGEDWDRAKREVQTSLRKKEADFTDKDWGLVNHLYHKYKKGELPPAAERRMVDKVIEATYWQQTAEMYADNLFELYRQFRKSVQAMPESMIRQERYSRAYANLVKNLHTSGILMADAESMRDFVAGYEDHYDLLA